VGAELIYADGRKDITKLTVTFRKLVNVFKKMLLKQNDLSVLYRTHALTVTTGQYEHKTITKVLATKTFKHSPVQ